VARWETNEKARPTVNVARQAREIFKRDYADVIQKGRSIKIARHAPGTVADLFRGMSLR
jgi:hypothetical protein